VSGPRPMMIPMRAGIRATSRQRRLRVTGDPARRPRGSRTSHQRTRGARRRRRAHQRAVRGGSRSRHHRRSTYQPPADSRASRNRLPHHRKRFSRPYGRPPRHPACGAPHRTTGPDSRRPIQRFRRRCRRHRRFPGARLRARCARPRHLVLRLARRPRDALARRPRDALARRPWPGPRSRVHRPVASGRPPRPDAAVDLARRRAVDCHRFRGRVR
jgi:hypothetical protein